MKTAVEIFYPKNSAEWRTWLQNNHSTKDAIWLLQYKKKSAKPSISWSEAVDEALCFGWIDSVRKTLEEETFVQFFSKRKPGGTWSKINKEKIKLLTAGGQMAEAGLRSMKLAQENGSWSILNEVDSLTIPPDLFSAFNEENGDKEYFLSLSNSTKKAILQWLVLAKKPETRQKRIDEVVAFAAMKMKPKHLR